MERNEQSVTKLFSYLLFHLKTLSIKRLNGCDDVCRWSYLPMYTHNSFLQLYTTEHTWKLLKDCMGREIDKFVLLAEPTNAGEKKIIHLVITDLASVAIHHVPNPLPNISPHILIYPLSSSPLACLYNPHTRHHLLILPWCLSGCLFSSTKTIFISLVVQVWCNLSQIHYICRESQEI